MLLYYLEVLSLIRLTLSLLIAKIYKLKSKYNYLYYIEFISIFLLSFNNIEFIRNIAIVILMSGIYGTINDLVFGWFSPQYWRENHKKDSSFLLTKCNTDNIPRPFHHAFIWGIYATLHYSMCLGTMTSVVCVIKEINVEELILGYLTCFGLMFCLSIEYFGLIKDNIAQEDIPKYINDFGYKNAIIFNNFLIFYFLFKDPSTHLLHA